MDRHYFLWLLYLMEALCHYCWKIYPVKSIPATSKSHSRNKMLRSDFRTNFICGLNSAFFSTSVFFYCSPSYNTYCKIKFSFLFYPLSIINIMYSPEWKRFSFGNKQYSFLTSRIMININFHKSLKNLDIQIVEPKFKNFWHASWLSSFCQQVLSSNGRSWALMK